MTLWVSLDEWLRLTPEERKQFKVGIDLTRGYSQEALAKAADEELQKDRDEYIDDMSIGGKRYRER